MVRLQLLSALPPAAKCSNYTDLRLTFTDPIHACDLPQRPSSTAVPLTTDHTAALATCGDSGQARVGPEVADRTDAAPQDQRQARHCKRGHRSGALILKPCKFAVKPVYVRTEGQGNRGR